MDSSNPVGAVHFGPFRVIEALGVGGSSTVYLGDRSRGFSQRVAIKVSHALSEHQDYESRALVSLDHPNIVRLLDQGLSTEGHQYLVMEYVEGARIDEFCDSVHSSIQDRLRLMLKVMAAVSFAHHFLIVHADLKPSNILVDSSGEPKLLDFGTAFTSFEGPQIGGSTFTPAFASPEQKRGSPITAATDVYGLGLLLKLLLMGPTPNAREVVGLNRSGRRRQANKLQLERLVDARSMPVSALRFAVSTDLEAVLDRALQDEPEDRYPSVDAFSADLRAYLENRPVSARPVTRARWFGKWILRNRVTAASAALVSAAILVSAFGITVQGARAEYQRRSAEARLRELVRLTSTLDGELYESIEKLPRSSEAKKTLLQAAAHTMDQIYAIHPADPSLNLAMAREYANLARLEAEPADFDREDRKQALAGLDKAIALMKQQPSSVARGELEGLQRLQLRLAR